MKPSFPVPETRRIRALQAELKSALQAYHRAEEQSVPTTEHPDSSSVYPHNGSSSRVPAELSHWWPSLMDNSKLLVAVFDLEDRCLFANQSWREAYGLQGEASLPLRSHYAGLADQSPKGRMAQGHSLTGEALRLEGDLNLKPKRSGRWFLWEVMPWYQRGQIAGTIYCAQEQTQKLKANQRARKLRRERNLAMEIAELSVLRWNHPKSELWPDERLQDWLGLPSIQPMALDHFYQHIHPDDRKAFGFYWQEPWNSGQSVEREYRLIGKNGQVFNCLERIDFERDKAGKPRQAVSVIQDIGHLRATQASLEESERRFRGIFNQMFQFIGLLKPDGTVIEANNTALAFAGLRPEEVVGRPFWEAHWWQTGPETVAKLKEAIQRAAKGGLVRYDAEVLGKEGVRAIIDFSLKPIKDADGQVILLIPEGRDVTEMRETQKKLEVTQRLFDRFMGYTPAMAWIKDQNLHFQYVNPPLARALNREVESLIGSTDADFLKPEVAEKINENDRKVLQTGQVLRFIEHAPQSDGSLSHVLSYKFPLVLPDGEAGIGGVAVDITAQVEAEQKLKALNQDLEEKVAKRTKEVQVAEDELTRLVYSIAHDLRAPLRHIAAYTDIVLEEQGGNLEPGSLERLERVFFSAEKLGDMVDELLRYARTDRQELDWGTLDLNELLDGLKTMVQPEGSEIQWNITNLPSMRADVLLMRQVWQNLLENAVKFTRTRQTATISVGYQLRDEDLLFWVQDNGVGFNPKYQDKLFKLFQRLHSEAQFSGTGIGLANVQRVVQRHGGRIWAEGQEGHGATFYLSFPQTLLL